MRTSTGRQWVKPKEEWRNMLEPFKTWGPGPLKYGQEAVRLWGNRRYFPGPLAGSWVRLPKRRTTKLLQIFQNARKGANNESRL